MAARGRPTPQSADGEASFQDRLPEELTRPDINPYLALHREFGRELLPAEQVKAYKGRWAELFGREGPLYLEIGSGNGEFMVELGRRHPDWNYVGIEIRYKRCVLCARKIRAAGLQNVVVARYHAAFLHDLFEPASLSGVFVNHPDPWPKERHEKNRLLSRWFLEDVVKLLKPGGFLRVKSDYAPNVERVAALIDHGPDGEPLPALPLRVTAHSADVNGEGAPWEDDAVTNYQTKMLRKGVPVHAIEVVRTGDPWPGA